MGLTKLSINRPLTMLMIILGLVVMGFMGYTRLQVDRMPKTDIPFVTVVVIYPGASPDEASEYPLTPYPSGELFSPYRPYRAPELPLLVTRRP